MRDRLLRRLEAKWAAALFVAGFAFLLFAPSIGWDYSLDDHQAVLAHPSVIGDAPLWEVFRREYWGEVADGTRWSSSYRPLTTLTLALEHRLTPAPWLHHLANCFWYAGLCAAVTRIARRWCAAPAALAVGLVFAAMPIHVESVASIVGRADVIASLLALVAADLSLPRDGRLPRRVAIFWASVAYLAALLCKESVALLPGVVGLLLLVEIRAQPRARAGRVLAPAFVLGGVGLLYLVARHTALSVSLPPEFVPADNLLIERHGWPRAWGNFGVLGHYLELTLAPVRLCSDHTYAEIVPPLGLWSAEAVRAWIGVLAVLVVVRDAWRVWHRRSPGLVCATALAYLLVGQWVIDLSVILAERLALWPSVWLCFALGHAVQGDAEAPSRRPRLAYVLFALLLSLLALRTLLRELDWRDDSSLQRAAVQTCPRAVHSRFILAQLERDHGHAREAVWQYAVAGAGRAAFPGEFDAPALEAETTLPLAERLPRIPELVGAPDRQRYWAQLHAYLVAEGAYAEADIVAQLARAGT